MFKLIAVLFIQFSFLSTTTFSQSIFNRITDKSGSTKKSKSVIGDPASMLVQGIPSDSQLGQLGLPSQNLYLLEFQGNKFYAPYTDEIVNNNESIIHELTTWDSNNPEPAKFIFFHMQSYNNTTVYNVEIGRWDGKLKLQYCYNPRGKCPNEFSDKLSRATKSIIIPKHFSKMPKNIIHRITFLMQKRTFAKCLL